MTNTNITVIHDSQEWSTDLAGDVSEIKIDGNRLSDIHDLSIKTDKVITIIRGLTLTTTILTVVTLVCCLYMSSWLASRTGEINAKLSSKVTDEKARTLQNSNKAMMRKLKSLGWEWEDKTWKQVPVTNLSPES